VQARGRKTNKRKTSRNVDQLTGFWKYAGSNREIRSIYLSPTMHYKDWCEKCCAPGRNALAHPLHNHGAKRERAAHKFRASPGQHRWILRKFRFTTEIWSKSNVCIYLCIANIKPELRALDKRASVKRRYAPPDLLLTGASSFSVKHGKVICVPHISRIYIHYANIIVL